MRLAIRATASSKEDLIERCVAGDTRAWRELHSLYRDRVARLLNRLGLPATEIEDVSQEVFVQVFRALGQFEKRADLGTWIYRIAVNQAGHYRRSRVPRFLQWLVPVLPEATTGLSLSESEAARQVRLALAQMKPAHRVALVLYEFEGLSGEEIASITASPIATVWRRLHYARREFESWFREPPRKGQGQSP